MHWTIPKCVDILTEHSSFRYERNDICHLTSLFCRFEEALVSSCFDTCAASHVWSNNWCWSSWLKLAQGDGMFKQLETLRRQRDQALLLFFFLETYCLFPIECISKISILRDSFSIWPGRQVLISETPWTSWNLSLGWTNFRTSFMSFWFSTWIWRLSWKSQDGCDLLYFPCSFRSLAQAALLICDVQLFAALCFGLEVGQSAKNTVFNATLSYATLSYVLWGFKTSWTLPFCVSLLTHQNHGISLRASITAKIWRGQRSSKHMSRNSTDWHATQKCDQHGYSGGTSWTLGGVLAGYDVLKTFHEHFLTSFAWPFRIFKYFDLRTFIYVNAIKCI